MLKPVEQIDCVDLCYGLTHKKSVEKIYWGDLFMVSHLKLSRIDLLQWFLGGVNPKNL